MKVSVRRGLTLYLKFPSHFYWQMLMLACVQTSPIFFASRGKSRLCAGYAYLWTVYVHEEWNYEFVDLWDSNVFNINGDNFLSFFLSFFFFQDNLLLDIYCLIALIVGFRIISYLFLLRRAYKEQWCGQRFRHLRLGIWAKFFKIFINRLATLSLPWES